jgi:AbrB family looped-hinge helix DNA binding protein
MGPYMGGNLGELSTVISRIGRKGQITIPQQVRDWLGIEEGDHIIFMRRGDHVVLLPMNKTLLDLRGMVAANEPQDFHVVRQQAREQRMHRRAHETSQDR